MRPKIKLDGDVAIVVLNNDFYKTKHYDTTIAALLPKHKKMVIDMRRICFFDSACCGVLVTYLKIITNMGGDIKLCRVCKSVLTLLELLRISRIIEIFETREEAVRSFD